MLKTQLLEKAINRAFDKLCDYFEQELTRQIEEEKWEWPNKTLRESGELAGTIRNIIDSGDLRDSLKTYILSPTHRNFVYNSEYADLVHNGGVVETQAGKKDYPARSWITTAVDEGDLREKFAEFLEKEL